MKLLSNSKLLLATIFINLLFAACAPKYTGSFNPTSNYVVPELKRDGIAEGNADSLHSIVEANRQVANKQKALPADQLIASADKKTFAEVLPNVDNLVKEHNKRIKEIKNSTVDKKVERKALKKERKHAKKEIKKQLKKDVKELRQTNDDEYVLMMILAVIIPPLGVGLVYGVHSEFWISLLLTLLFWLPGAIYSVIKVNEYYKG